MLDNEKHTLVLIIDDEDPIRDGCAQSLSKWGYEVITAATGEEGIHLARERKPALVYLDLKMPGMSGMEVMEILIRDIPDIVPIIITGYASIVSVVEAMQKGAYDYLPKPFVPDQLRAVAKRAREHRNLKIEARHLREESENFQRGFITFVSHEMRTPLITIEQYFETIRYIAGETLPKDILDILARCEKRIKNLDDLIEHWLDYSRIDNGSYSHTQDEVDVFPLIASAVEDLQPLCSRREIMLETYVPDNLPRIKGDPDSLLRVLINIIGNATKYTPLGGSIIVVGGFDDHYLSITIMDTGSGIPQDKLPFIFEPFYRVKGKAERYRGSGLGLAFCKKIMDAHNGKIEVTSTEGKGTTFVLRFPR